MRMHVLLGGLGIALAAATSSVQAVDITGAGATFPYPIYAKWAEAYKAKTGGGMNYQSIGSGGGIAQIKAKTVDFGASDMPLKAEDLQAAGLTQFPAIIGGVVPDPSERRTTAIGSLGNFCPGLISAIGLSFHFLILPR